MHDGGTLFSFIHTLIDTALSNINHTGHSSIKQLKQDCTFECILVEVHPFVYMSVSISDHVIKRNNFIGIYYSVNLND